MWLHNKILLETFANWLIESGKGKDKIKHCTNLTEGDICKKVLGFISGKVGELKYPEKFLYFVANIATAVSDEYYWRWSTSISPNDNWCIYEDYLIPRLTARAIQEMAPDVIDKNIFICDVDKDSVLLKNIIQRYELIKDNEQQRK